MLIDFCNAELVTDISSSVCESEGYEVKNLISKAELERNKGFLVDYFIKPPVTVQLRFLCEIQLNHIILWSRVGAQKTVGVELLTCLSDNSEYNSVGSAFMTNDINDDLVGFVFCKRGDKPVKLVNINNFLVQSFKSQKFLRTQNLQIKILKTLGSSVPALQRIEIWGEICSNCPKKTLAMQAWANVRCAQSSHRINAKVGSATSKNCRNVLSAGLRVPGNSSGLKIPDEFLDPISCEVMATPMIMPSGKVIDNSTLERFIEEEAKWGRFPSDPFTGKLFSKTSRPKMSVALKTRIDKFLLDNSDELIGHNIPRTVGDSRSINVPLVSSLVSTDEAEVNEPHCSATEPEHLKLVGDNSRHSINNNISMDRKRKFSCIKDNFEFVEKDTNSVDNSISNAGIFCKVATLDSSVAMLQKYDEMKEKSLDCLLKATLSSLPSFTKTAVSGKDQIVCFKCNSVNVLYQLPCKHFVCRICLCALTKTNSCRCMLCSTSFKSNDLKRIHLK